MPRSALEEVVSLVKSRTGDPLSFADTIDYGAHDDFQILVAAIECKESGWETGGLEVAERMLKRLLAKSPDYAAGFYELAVVHRFQRRLSDALNCAVQAARKAPGNLGYGVFQAHMFYANGCWDEGDAALDGIVAAHPGERAQIAAMRGFGAYLKEFPRERARYITDEIRRRHYWMSVEEVAAAITSAIRSRRGFALVRLGDGEGTFARVNPADEQRFADLYDHCRRFWVTFLLGESFDPSWTGYEALTAHLMPTVEQADILGVAYWDWIDYEYSIAAERTIPCLLNINRYVLENVRYSTLCNQDIHLQLYRTGLLAEVMREVPSATVISCLDGLDAKIREMFGIADVDLIRIPSESHAPHLAHVAHRTDKPHFPQVFWDLMHALARPHHGRVFLIAAGTFGKYYACVIKQHGGIALDLGSIVDGWMKLASRPGYGSVFGIGGADPSGA
ncbi:tetratricopeptide repeat protein [Methylobacterium sp. ID0610]|uniref:tetratricopeptide repeat protein n=1 Tax=Methylobacterium carpenticola TaxID=3344827 RepID=UPI0036AE00DB